MLPDHGYVLPSDKPMRIVDGRLKLEPRGQRDGMPTVIDACLTSLGDEGQDRADGVILWGTGADGTAAIQQLLDGRHL